VTEDPFGDVRHRQVGDRAILLDGGEPLPDGAKAVEHGAVLERHALRWPRGAGGVHERADLVGLRPCGGGLRVEVRRAPAFQVGEAELAVPVPLALVPLALVLSLAVHDHGVGQARVPVPQRPPALQQCTLGDQHAGFGVVEDVGELAGRRGGVEREGDRTEQQRPQVSDVELHPGGEQQGDPVAALDPEGPQAPGHRCRTIGPLPQRQLLSRLEIAQRDPVRLLGDPGQEHRGQARRARRAPGRAVDVGAGHDGAPSGVRRPRGQSDVTS